MKYKAVTLGAASDTALNQWKFEQSIPSMGPVMFIYQLTCNPVDKEILLQC